MFSRRRFLQTLLGGAAATAILPYVPKSYFFLGKSAGVATGISLANLNEIVVANYLPGVIDNFFKSEPLLTYLQDHQTSQWNRLAGRALTLPIQTYQPEPLIGLASPEDVRAYAAP